MKILVVDDGQLAINSLIRILCRVAPDCDYILSLIHISEPTRH